MILRLMRTVFGLMLIAIGVVEGGWALLACWLGCNFVVLGIAHALGAHRVLGKRSDGSLPLWSRVVFLPFLIYSHAVWWVIEILSREPAHNAVTDQLIVGRRLLASELDQDFD